MNDHEMKNEDMDNTDDRGNHPMRLCLERFLDNRPAVISSVILAGLLLIILVAPLAPNYHPDTITDSNFSPPSLTHWMGTDDHGRDLWSRIIFGARISLLVGIIGAAVSFIIGTTWGIIAGYFGGRLDQLMMRFVDILYSLPSIIFVIVLLTTMKDILLASPLGKALGDHSGLLHFMLLFAGLGAVSWLTLARIVRGQVLALKSQPFLESCHSLGLGDFYIISRHIIPNIMGIVLTYVMLTIPSVILYESFLSFLGLGIESPFASLGSLISRGVPQINPIRIYWWLIAFPTIFLGLLLISLNFLGDGLKDAFNPKA